MTVPLKDRFGGVPKAVVVHAGARDSYQLAYALAEVGLLEALVTNVYSAEHVRRNYGVDLERLRYA